VSRTETEQAAGRIRRAGSEQQAQDMIRRQMSAAREPMRPQPSARPPAPARVGAAPSLDRSTNAAVPHHAEQGAQEHQSEGRGVLGRLADVEAAVRELALEDPRHFQEKISDFREALKRLVAAYDGIEQRLARVEALLS
jgi:hypothetical protein